jgi:glycine/D-amino acid oxidase-like deaminating enzyme
MSQDLRPAEDANALPSRARVVIVGGGVIGCSVAYHLTKLGWTDVVGHTLGGAVGLGPVENTAGVTPDYVNSGSYVIEISGKRYPARASLRPMYDPQGLRIRS